MKTLRYAALIGLVGLVSNTMADTVVAPGDLATTEGDINNIFPFDIGDLNINSARYQQVYDANIFSSLPAGGVKITGISFRVDGGTGSSFFSILPNIQVDLSTTSAGENTLSSTFANNVGANDTVVYARGALTLSGTAAGFPSPFNVTINFSQPFVYDPANGNLLLDVRNYAGGITTLFDATDSFGDGIARAYAYVGSGASSPTAYAVDTYGLVTEFIYQAVPEPSTLALTGLSGLSLLLFRRHRK
jgi:hypothetical protein